MKKSVFFSKLASNHQDPAATMQELFFSPPASSIPSSFRVSHLVRLYRNLQCLSDLPNVHSGHVSEWFGLMLESVL